MPQDRHDSRFLPDIRSLENDLVKVLGFELRGLKLV